MKYILSLATTSKRINDFICNIKTFDDNNNADKVIINVCAYYKRLNEKLLLDTTVLKKIQEINRKYTTPKYILQVCSDCGPLTKYIGGRNYMIENDLTSHKLIIIDDDILYSRILFWKLMEEKNENNITTGSGFNIVNGNYTPRFNECNYVEGYSGICFDFLDLSNEIHSISQYYKIIDFTKNSDDFSHYLKALFMGDDFLISNIYPNKHGIQKGTQLLQTYQYGMEDDALHKNTLFGTNMGTYKYLSDNDIILKSLKNKISCLAEIISTQYKIKIGTWYDEKISSYADPYADLNNQYCKKNGYQWISDDKIKHHKNRAPAYEKVPFILRHLNNCDYFIWIDADAFFYLDSRRITDVINKYPDTDFFWSEDMIHNEKHDINTGFIIIKNTDYSKKILKHWDTDEELYENGKKYCEYYWEQSSLRILYAHNYLDLQKHSKMFKYGFLQEFKLRTGQNKPFIFHAAGFSEAERINFISEYLKSIK